MPISYSNKKNRHLIKKGFNPYVLPDEIVQLYENFNQLSNREKGDLIGFAMGKYGIDIFATSSIFKGIEAFRQVKKANTICNFESMIANGSTKLNIISRSIERETPKGQFIIQKMERI